MEQGIMNYHAGDELAEASCTSKQGQFKLSCNNKETASPWMAPIEDQVNVEVLLNDWGNLPHVVLENVFQNSSESTLLSAQFVCKRWYDVIHNSANLWREKLFRFSGRDPKDLTNAPYKYASNYVRTFGKYIQYLEIKLFSPISSSVCKKFQKCLKICLSQLAKSKAEIKVFSIPGMQLDRSHWVLYREDMCTSLARFFCKSQHTLQDVCLCGTRANFDDGYKVLFALGYNTGGTVTHLNIQDMFVSRRPIFDISQFCDCFKNFQRLQELQLNFSYISEELLEVLAENLHQNSLQRIDLRVTQHDPHSQVIWGHSWTALVRRCPDLKVAIYFQRVMTYEQHFRILLPQIPLAEVTFDGCYFADRDWQICPTLTSILPHFKSTLERVVIDVPDTRENFQAELLTLIEACPNLWYLKISAYITTKFVDNLLQSRSEHKCNVDAIKIRIFVRDYNTDDDEIDLERIYSKHKQLICNDLLDYYASCCVAM